MTPKPTDPVVEERRELQSRVRIGVTGLAFIFVLVLLVASFSGSASDEPALTSDTRREGSADMGASGEHAPPQEPLAELGVAPGGGSASQNTTQPATPDDTGVIESLEELDSGNRR